MDLLPTPWATRLAPATADVRRRPWLTLAGTLNQKRVLCRRMPCDPERDFVHVAGFVPGPSVLAVPISGPRGWGERVERAQRGRQTFGNHAQVSLPHMMARQLADRRAALDRATMDRGPLRAPCPRAPSVVDRACARDQAHAGLRQEPRR